MQGIEELKNQSPGGGVPLAEGCVFESQPRQTKVVKTCRESSTARRSAIGVSVISPRDDHNERMPRVKVIVIR